MLHAFIMWLLEMFFYPFRALIEALRTYMMPAPPMWVEARVVALVAEIGAIEARHAVDMERQQLERDESNVRHAAEMEQQQSRHAVELSARYAQDRAARLESEVSRMLELLDIWLAERSTILRMFPTCRDQYKSEMRFVS